MNNIPDITVFTATYNRGDFLKNIYNDLKKQTFKNFEWLIVDDGSSDNTRDIVESFIKEKIIKIKYIYKYNGGRHSAINLGVNNASGTLFLLLDSDDRIVKNALENICDIWNKHKDKDNIAGILTLCKDKKGRLIGSKFPQSCKEVSFCDVYNKYNVTGDKFTCFVTEILKRYPFPEKEDVRFVMEAVVWHEISKKYNMICENEVLQIVNYQRDGLSNTEYTFDKVNGLAFSYLNLINNKTYTFKKYPKLWAFNYIFLIAYSKLYNLEYFKYIEGCSSKILYFLFYPLGYVLYVKINRYIQEDNN